MATEQALPIQTSEAPATDPVPSAQPPAAADEARPATTETTSEANKAIAEAEVVAPVEPPSAEAALAPEKPEGDATTEPTTTGAESGETVVAPDADAAGGTEGLNEPSSAKKNQKRKSTGGVPEHKGKKLNRKKSMPTLNLDAEPGDYFWARLKGYPPWPAIVCDEEMLPEPLLANRPVTAKRPDGTYRPDYEEGGKNVKERTYPVMYLGTNEFSWTPNTDLTRLDFEDVRNAEPGKKSKQLWNAYEVAREGHDLQHFKDLLLEHERLLQEDNANEEAMQLEKLAKKKDKQERRKSKDKADDGDVEMEDVEDGEGKKKAKASKKRKSEVEGDSEKPAKTAKTKLKVNLNKAQNGDSAKSKSKAKPESADEAGPQPTEAERILKRQKEVLYFRHKLQKGFLSDSAPSDEVLKQMHEYIRTLEMFHKDLETSIIRQTKIHKVLKAMLKHDPIPKDEEYNFRKRAVDLLDIWQKLLSEDTASTEKKDEDTPNGVSKDEKEEKTEDDDAAAAAPSIETDKPVEAAAEEPATETETVTEPPSAPVETALAGNDAQDEAAVVENKMEVDPPTAPEAAPDASELATAAVSAD